MLGLSLRLADLLAQGIRLAGRHSSHERLDVLVGGEPHHEIEVVRARPPQTEPLTLERVGQGLGVAGAVARRRASCMNPDPRATPARMSRSPRTAFSVIRSSRKTTP